MAILSLPLSDDLKSFLDKEADLHGHADAGDYVRALIEKERRRQELRALVLEGLQSPVGRLVDEGYVEALRDRVQQRPQARQAVL